MRSFLLDLLFPSLPLGREPMAGSHDSGGEGLRAHPLCFEGRALIRRGMPSLDRLVCGASYAASPVVQEAIRRFKYRRGMEYGEHLGRMLVATAAFVPTWPPPVLCPVPLHWTRQFTRGFNQAEVLATAVSAARGWPVASLLRRMRPTGAQAKRCSAERRRALDDAFAWCGDRIPLRVVLVDDVVTTGATLDACARVLREVGVARVDAITIAVAFA
jgi:ComF family protein